LAWANISSPSSLSSGALMITASLTSSTRLLLSFIVSSIPLSFANHSSSASFSSDFSSSVPSVFSSHGALGVPSNPASQLALDLLSSQVFWQSTSKELSSLSTKFFSFPK